MHTLTDEDLQIVVSDTRPLIALGQLDLIKLLGAIFVEVQVQVAVCETAP